jgi:NAD-dependent dihydropyrimidine dehydrogenase PreA subunit
MIDPKKCVGCEMRMNCGRNVYNWTKKGARAARPYQCIVGFSPCTNLFPGKAITFPDREIVRAIYKKSMWAKGKKQLTAEVKLQIKKD